MNLPTGVGMYRRQPTIPSAEQKSPHRRGDVPGPIPMPISVLLISPQAWGCTGSDAGEIAGQINLPTGVGMYRTIRNKRHIGQKSPHRRGDVPQNGNAAYVSDKISPQAWGCTEVGFGLFDCFGNLPTGVGMYRAKYGQVVCESQSPHRRGDVPHPLIGAIDRA